MLYCTATYAASWCKYRDHLHVHLVKYDDMLDNPMSNIEEIALYLGYSLTKGEASRINEKNSFSAMKAGVASALFSNPNAFLTRQKSVLSERC